MRGFDLLKAASAALIAFLPGCAKEAPPDFALSPCSVEGTEERALCGLLEVPENWKQPYGRTIFLNVVVAPAVNPSGLAPLFDIAGGPGVAATQGAGFYFTDGAAIRAKRDVVMVDQRGTGASAPLRCPDLESASPLTRMYPTESVRACRDAMSGDHDLTQYTTLAAARDLDAVRNAIGAEKVDLFGLSYGTKLAQAFIREYPGRVRSAMLMGSAPMDLRTPLFHARNAENALRLIFADCAADAACAAAYPLLEAQWSSVLARFDAGAVAMATPDGDLLVERGPFTEAFRALLTSEGGQRLAPKLIHAAASGDFAPFVAAAASGPRGFIAEGLYLSVECAEGAPLISEADIVDATKGTFLGRYRVDEQLVACAHWPKASVNASFAHPVKSDVPVFILAGGRDHVTPKEYAMRIAQGFSNSRIVVVDEMAHFPGAISGIECIDQMALAFDQNADPDDIDASCIESMKAPPFALPD